MTTGSRVFGSPTGDYYYVKTWSGSDGKYSMVFGQPVLNWHPYTMTTHLKQRRMSPYNRYIDSWTGDGPNALSASEENVLLGRLMTAIRGTDFNGSVASATLHQSVDTVLTTLTRFGRCAASLRRGNFHDAARLLGVDHPRGWPRHSRAPTSRDVAARWLELQYGWLPLLSDTYDGWQAVNEVFKGPRKITASASFTHRESKTIGAPAYSANEVMQMTLKVKYIHEMTEQMSSARQLGLEQPLSVAWELLPWSFVVDWFIPIGTYVSNLEQIPRLSGTTMKSSMKSFHITGTGNSALTRGATLQHTGCYYNRTSVASLSVPFPDFSGVSGVASGNRIANAIALCRQRFA